MRYFIRLLGELRQVFPITRVREDGTRQALVRGIGVIDVAQSDLILDY